MRLTEHFTLEEFTRSATAKRLEIDNTAPAPVVAQLHLTAQRMEAVRALLGAPIRITSGYRCEALERALCAKAWKSWCIRHAVLPDAASWDAYFKRKQHPSGCAVDFIAPAFGTPYEICAKLARHAAELRFDQLIHEYRDWVHIGFGGHGRQQLLTIDARGTFPGILA